PDDRAADSRSLRRTWLRKSPPTPESAHRSGEIRMSPPCGKAVQKSACGPTSPPGESRACLYKAVSEAFASGFFSIAARAETRPDRSLLFLLLPLNPPTEPRATATGSPCFLNHRPLSDENISVVDEPRATATGSPRFPAREPPALASQKSAHARANPRNGTCCPRQIAHQNCRPPHSPARQGGAQS